jgi:sugar phosphate isomerase/epimerase
MLNRRELLQAGVALLPARADSPRRRMGVVIHSYGIRGSVERDRDVAIRLNDPLNFLAHGRQLGAGGVQLGIGTRDRDYIGRLRKALEESGLYLEGSISLPRDQEDVERFTAELQTARAAGVRVLRCAIGGRRYEIFDAAADFRRFAERAWQALTLAEPIVARHDLGLAIENHKDWLMDELLDLVKRISSKHVGVTVDTGNSIALLEDPTALVEALAPWALSTHIKDMGVQEYAEGFLLSEVPLGTGFLDLKKIVQVLRQARPEVQFSLEMITRDPLRVPCLTTKYWSTLDKVPARQLAEALARVRRHAARELPRVSHLNIEDRLKAEEENVRQSLAYAREQLGL